MQKGQAFILDTRHSAAAQLHPISVNAVTLEAGFWQARCRQNLQVSIPHLFDMLKEHGVLRNFQRVYGEVRTAREGALFTDSDLYKWCEAAAWALASEENATVREQLEEALEVIEKAQQPDGYLNTFHLKLEERWTNVTSNHELYCAGHLFQAAIALKRALGDDRLLKAAVKFADNIDSVFGPGKRTDWPGHPEIELALVELYRETGEQRYLALAKFFLDAMHFAEQREVWGHAVRMGYFACGGVDYYLETGDGAYSEALRSLWRSLVDRKLYFTGSSASRYTGESFGHDYELPNARAYSESCAGLSNLFWAWRMLQGTPSVEYADLVERVLYNHLLASVSLDGERYFYMNPLASTGKPEPGMWYPWEEKPPYERTAWHGCTCCPPNIQRTIAQLAGYMYSTSAKGLWVHLYDASTLEGQLENGVELTVHQETEYPWQGQIKLTVEVAQTCEFTLHLRIPGWADRAWVQVGDEMPQRAEPGTYFALERIWEGAMQVLLELSMEPTFWQADMRVSEDRSQTALMRGPVVYCLEDKDNPGLDLASCAVDCSEPAKATWEPELLKGLMRLKLQGRAVVELDENRPLYFRQGKRPAQAPVELEAIPYYAWGNRGAAQMCIWMPRVED